MVRCYKVLKSKSWFSLVSMHDVHDLASWPAGRVASERNCWPLLVWDIGLFKGLPAPSTQCVRAKFLDLKVSCIMLHQVGLPFPRDPSAFSLRCLGWVWRVHGAF